VLTRKELIEYSNYSIMPAGFGGLVHDECLKADDGTGFTNRGEES